MSEAVNVMSEAVKVMKSVDWNLLNSIEVIEVS